MAGLGLKDLPLPLPQYDPLGTYNFETEQSTEIEDRLVRSPALLEQAFAGGRLINRRRALALGRRLGALDAPATLASSRHMMDQRRRVIGDLWRLHVALGPDSGTPIHLVAEGSTVQPAALMDLDPRLLGNALRSDLNRARPRIRSDAPSGLIAFVHGEFNRATGTFGVHFHGYAFGDLLAAVEALRSRPKYMPGGPLSLRDAIARPVVIKREPMTDLPYPLTYIWKSFWPGVMTSKGIDRYRGTRHETVYRVPEPHHTLSLMYLDQWTLADVSLIMGMHVTRSGLAVRNAQVTVHA